MRRLNSTDPREEEMDQCCRVTLIQGREFGPALNVEMERRPSISNTNAALQLCIWVLIIFAFLLGAYIEVCVLYGLQIHKRFCRVFVTLLGSAVSVVWEERVAERGAILQIF